ncbi:hypothetical protein K1T71_000030 [Dendrolimus kikuchii]|uniref:Uncharacterized protein n=1 Tax=Dendrolimus kikuchii TaxID=765133 RepID=A0ACC1DJM8_9NEOP|nr:hypothetical protein K1T71_000030 [Dendrolimus kikuchii]
MHVRVRTFGKPEQIVLVESKLAKIEKLRHIIQEKFQVKPDSQRLFYGGKLLENGYTLHDYNIKLNDVIQLMITLEPVERAKVEVPNVAGSSIQANEETIVYKDAKSTLYAVGDLIDMRDCETGAWLEGKITRIVYDPSQVTNTTSEDDIQSHDLPAPEANTSSNKVGIKKYFTKPPNNNKVNVEEKLLYKVDSQCSDEQSEIYSKGTEIRPRSRIIINVKDLQVGQKVMLNYNPDEPSQLGYWYDFKVLEIKTKRTTHELLGEIYIGPNYEPEMLIVTVIDKIYKIEEPVPLDQQTDKYRKLMTTETDKRSLPPVCSKCHDDDNVPCQECGCNICSGKEDPDKIVLCDECDLGFHIACLDPPLTELPDDDWYCPYCKRDANEVIAPGAAKQTKKTTKTTRDWGRGMACVGKTKTCHMPANHFGPIPGIDVGMCWRFRIQLSESGVHRPPVSGIHGRDTEGAYSIVLSGGYEDDIDNGYEFTYTGSGGRDLSGNKRTAEHSCDQKLTRQNRALARNCAVPKLNEEGADAGDKWRDGKPVRVVRSYKMQKHDPLYAPKEGIRYDGIYKVVKYYPEVGLSGYKVWKYLLRRDDPSPAPWEKGAKQYPIVYPDGYLEAEAEKVAAKGKKSVKSANEKKRALPERNDSVESDDREPQNKKIKLDKQTKNGPNLKGKRSSIMKPAKSPQKENKNPRDFLSVTVKEAISKDTMNKKLWDECFSVLDTKGKKEFVDYLAAVFICSICQDVAADPVTTPCLHNFCLDCVNQVFRPGAKICACCRNDLTTYVPEINIYLKIALQSILTGYDYGRN